MEINTCKFLSTVVRDIFSKANIAVLSGPCFAIEVANRLPTAVLLASKEKNFSIKSLN